MIRDELVNHDGDHDHIDNDCGNDDDGDVESFPGGSHITGLLLQGAKRSRQVLTMRFQ